MRRKIFFCHLMIALLALLLVRCDTSKNEDNNGGTPGSSASSPFIIDHTCTDVSRIPDQYIQQVKDQFRFHYAHTSHGGQIVTGLTRLASSSARGQGNAQPLLANRYGFHVEYCSLPQSQNTLRMMDGQMSSYCETYVTPDLYWESDYGMSTTRSVLNNFDVNVSMFAWCSQLDYYSQSEVQTYLNRMSQLESEFPDVTFIYMTGNAQSEDQNRVDRNNQIREYCRNNGKFLFDFADLDCWYNGQQHTVNGIPMEHPHYHGDEAGHTTHESCANKARAFWWMMARLAGWDGN